MIANPFYLLSLLTSSFLAFFTVAFVIELFQIKNHRLRSCLRILPLLSLVIDFFFNQYSLASWMNPLSCASCVQNFVLDVFFPDLKAYLNENHISLIHYLGKDHQHLFFSAVCIAFIAASCCFVLRTVFHTFSLMRFLRSIIKNASFCTHPIENRKLARLLQKKKVRIYVSDEIQVPLAYSFNVIIIPQKICSLHQAEFDAIVAHELEHLKAKDPLTRLLIYVIGSLFWWVTMSSWLKKIEQDQEMACDQSILKYGLKAESIASALVKVTKQVRAERTLCYFSNQTHCTLARLQALLGLSSEHSSFEVSIFVLSLGLAMLAICT